MKEMCKTY